MKKLTLTLILCVALSALAAAAPAISVVPAVYDFGSVFEGIAVSHTFTIKNTGNETLEISGIRASCGCTTTALATDSIAPGESVALDVLVNTTGFSGTISKSITIYSNDQGAPMLTLRVTGQVLKSDPYHITASDAYYLLYLLIDLRSPEEYEAHHFLGAANIPTDALADTLSQIPHETFIILYDNDGNSVDEAALALRNEGFAFVHTLLGGINEWVYQYDLKNILSTSGMFTLPPRVTIDTSNRNNTQLVANELAYLFYLLIDVRSADEFAESHIMGAINIPYDELEAWSDVLPSDILLIAYDQDGTIADQAALWLVNNNFSSARSLLGGLNEWIRQYGQDYLLSSTP